MKVRVLLFALARELAGRGQVELELPEPAAVADVRDALVRAYPALADIVRRSMFAVNQEYRAEGDDVPPDAEVACIPPVSGG
jgi:molybdopterin converting factor subunit 1